MINMECVVLAVFSSCSRQSMQNLRGNCWCCLAAQQTNVPSSSTQNFRGNCWCFRLAAQQTNLVVKCGWNYLHLQYTCGYKPTQIAHGLIKKALSRSSEGLILNNLFHYLWPVGWDCRTALGQYEYPYRREGTVTTTPQYGFSHRPRQHREGVAAADRSYGQYCTITWVDLKWGSLLCLNALEIHK